MAAAPAVAKGLRSVASRAVHIKVEPAPRNMYEGRHVLRILREFGQITMFRSLRHDVARPAPNSILAIFQTSEAASKILSESPLRFTVEGPQPQASVMSAASFGMSTIFRSEPAPVEASKADDQTGVAPAGAAKAEAREFFLSVDKTFADFQAVIERQPYYWGFVQSTKSFAYDDLVKSVPLEGLATISACPVTLPNRVIKQNAAPVAARKTLRQVRDEALPPHAPNQNISSRLNSG